MINIDEFMAAAPATSRERVSIIRDAINNNKLYISLITKNNKKHFKIYYNSNGVIKSKQAKATPAMQEYIKSKLNQVVLSEDTKDLLNITK